MRRPRTSRWKRSTNFAAWAVKVVEQVVLDRNMPVGNETDMTEAERAALARWAEGLK